MSKKKKSMVNITINIPNCHDDNIQKLIKMKMGPSKSEFIRIALGEFLQREQKNIQLLGFNSEKLGENKSLSSKHKI